MREVFPGMETIKSGLNGMHDIGRTAVGTAVDIIGVYIKPLPKLEEAAERQRQDSAQLDARLDELQARHS